MQVRFGKGLVHLVAVMAAAGHAGANRLTFEVWADPNPAHAAFCSIALADGWLSLVQVRGAGLPGPRPQRWRASAAEEDAMTAALQAFLAGDLVSVDPYGSRLPAAPFVTVTWMTTLDNDRATGLYIQPGLPMPPVLADLATALGLGPTCGLSAKAVE